MYIIEVNSDITMTYTNRKMWHTQIKKKRE